MVASETPEQAACYDDRAPARRSRSDRTSCPSVVPATRASRHGWGYS